jgi:regulator of protease activity HflC (stomatin/prohibitin superfamily)
VTIELFIDVLLGLSVAFLVIGLTRGSLVFVERGTARVVERLGRFHRVAGAGVNLRLPLVETFGPPIDLEVQHQEVHVETLTEDGVFVDVTVAVQFCAVQAQLVEAGYRVNEVPALITRVVQEGVRERIPLLRMEALEIHRRTVAEALVGRVTPALALVGYETLRVTVTDLRPDATVRTAIAQLQAAQRVRAAAAEHAAAQRLLEVQAAETRAECKALDGRGVADERHAILLGLRDSIEDLRRGIPGASLTEVMDLVVAAQYLDVLREVGGSARSRVVFLPTPGSSPAASARSLVPRVGQVAPTVLGELARSSARALASG